MATEDRDPCERVDALLAELSGVDGREADLPGGEGDALLRHAAACSRCRRALEGYRRTVELLRALPAVSAPPDLAARVRRGIAAARGRPLAIVRRAVSPLPVSLAAASIFALVAALWILWESRTPRGLHDLARDERALEDRPAVTESADRDEFAERPGATVAAPAAEVAAEPLEGAELDPVLLAVAVPPSRPIDPGEVDLLRRGLEAQFSHGARGGDGAAREDVALRTARGPEAAARPGGEAFPAKEPGGAGGAGAPRFGG
ncbi:MAG: hypothetical protein ACUVYA_12090, partial [Planctomycetota bacterium]